MQRITELNTIIELENVSADVTPLHFPTSQHAINGISIVAMGAGYAFDVRIEVSNTPDIEESWVTRPTTVLTGIDDTRTPVGYDLQTGHSYARLVFENVSGSIDLLKITLNGGGVC